MQVCWDDNTNLAIDSNEDPITYLKEYAVIIGMPYPKLYRYWCYENPNSQLIGTGAGNNSTLMNGADIYFMGDVLVWSDYGNNGINFA